jgi:hypothetical protein
MPRLSVVYGPYEYWCIVQRAPSIEQRTALADEVARRLVEAAPLAPGGHVRIILDAMSEAKCQLDAPAVAVETRR